VAASDLLVVLSPTKGAGLSELQPAASSQITAKISIDRKLSMLQLSEPPSLASVKKCPFVLCFAFWRARLGSRTIARYCDARVTTTRNHAPVHRGACREKNERSRLIARAVARDVVRRRGVRAGRIYLTRFRGLA
jgi:hypothetical protein